MQLCDFALCSLCQFSRGGPLPDPIQDAYVRNRADSKLSRVFGMTNLKSRTLYLLLLLGQLTGALFTILDGLAEFRHLVAYPGEQLPFERSDNLAAPIMIVAMQVAYW